MMENMASHILRFYEVAKKITKNQKYFCHRSMLPFVASLCTVPIYSPGPDLKVLTASFHEDKKAATVKNQATKITSMTKGTKGKNSVDIMWPTAIDPSSISSIAILILVNMKQRSSKMMSNVIPLMIRKTIQVCESSKYDPKSVVNSKPPMSKLLLLPSSVNLNPQ